MQDAITPPTLDQLRALSPRDEQGRARVVMLGMGAVGRCSLPIMLDHLGLAPAAYLVVDMDPLPVSQKLAADRGVELRVAEVTRLGYRELLDDVLADGGLLVDLAYNLATLDLLSYCRDRGVRFVNASLELWDPYAEASSPQERTLYHRQMQLRGLTSSWEGTPTAVLDHGANPGLVSHFTKAALRDLTAHLLEDKPSHPRAEEIRAAREGGRYAELAMLLEVRAIHISERDTQVSDLPKEPDEFVNTWSVEGLYEEATAFAELGWGSHEETLPEGAITHSEGPRNQIALPSRGCETLVRSLVPRGEIVGMLVRHGEAFTISDHLTVWEEGEAVYRPTVHYAYCLTDAAIASLYELRMRRWELQERQRVMTDEITEGRDEFGILLLGHEYGAWWYGGLLDIHESREILPGENATTIPVAAGVVAAAEWALQNPSEGVLVPDEVPFEPILERVRPYLGPVISAPYSWDPIRGVTAPEDGQAPEEAWQFASFRV